MNETETKILAVDTAVIASRLEALGAKKVADTFLVVDWLRFPLEEGAIDPWYFRIRSYKEGKVEMTWKGKSVTVGIARSHPEINILVDSHEKAKQLCLEIGMVAYAHQEKYRVSWEFNGARFDLDTYPYMPPYLEIEGESIDVINEMVKILNLESHESSSEGERVLIEKKYGLDWNAMHFSEVKSKE